MRKVPSALKEMQGRRVPKDEPKPEPMASLAPPRYLSPAGQAEWIRCARPLAQAGILTELDRGVLTLYCDAVADYCDVVEALADAEAGRPVRLVGVHTQQSLLKLKMVCRQEVLRFAIPLGMAPTARVGLSAKVAPMPAGPSSTDHYFTTKEDILRKQLS